MENMIILALMLAIIRAFLLLISMAMGILIIYIGLPFSSNGLNWGMRIRAYWLKCAMYILNIEVKIEGSIPQGSGLVVSNHLSMMDPFILLRWVRAFPLSKGEVADYPVVGQGAKATGVIFVKRKDHSSRFAAKKAIHKGLLEDKCILVFPEGTISGGGKLLPFQKGSIATAIETGQPVYPVCISYSSDRDIWKLTDSTWQHFTDQFGKWKTEVQLSFGAPLRDDSVEALVSKSRAFIEEKSDLYNTK